MSLSKGVIAVAGILIAAGVAVTQRRGDPFVVRIEEHHRVVLEEPSLRATRTIYEYEPYKRSQGWLHDLSLSPNGKRIAVVATDRGAVSGIEYSRLPSNELHILALDGSVVAVIQKDVQAYTWCCDGEQLAYIVGPYREGTPEFTPKGVYLYDLNSRRETELPVPHSVYRIQWAPFDSSLYFVRVAPGRDGKVLRYHLPTSRTSPSRYRDIVFSPSGKHYLFYSADDEERGPAWHLIERESGREFPIPDTSMGAVSGWAFGMGDRLLLARVRPVTTCPSGKRQELRECDAETIGYSIYDVLRSAVVLRIDGRIVREAAASDQSLVVTRGGRLEMVRDALR